MTCITFCLFTYSNCKKTKKWQLKIAIFLHEIPITISLRQKSVSKKTRRLPPRRSSLFVRLVGRAVTRFENLSTVLFLRQRRDIIRVSVTFFSPALGHAVFRTRLFHILCSLIIHWPYVVYNETRSTTVKTDRVLLLISIKVDNREENYRRNNCNV